MKNKVMSIMMSPTVRQRLIEKAQAEGRPVSQVIEEMCARQLDAESQIINVDTLTMRARS